MANLSNINGKFVVEQTTGYVGVGTTDPNYPIEVLNASAEIALNASGGSIYRVQSDSTDSFRINKNGVGDRLVIDGSGNSTFAGKIEVNSPQGDSNVHHKMAGNGGFDKYSNVNDGIYGYIGTGSHLLTPVVNDDDFVVRAEGEFAVSIGAAEKLRIDSSGNATFQESIIFNNGAPFAAAASIRQQSDILILTGGGNGFAFNDDTNAVSNMLIDSGGNVGIGITSPNAKLDVLQETRISYLQGNQYRTRITNTDGNTRILSDGQQSNIIFGTTGLVANGTASEKMRINWEGNVGIGTTLPTTALTIRKAISPTAYGGEASMIEFKSYYAGYDIETVKSAIYSGVSGQTGLQTTKGFMSFWTADEVSGGGQSLTEKMRIESDGFVRIGNPSAVNTYSPAQGYVAGIMQQRQTAQASTPTLDTPFWHQEGV